MGAVADHGHGFFTECGQHKLAFFPVFFGFSGHGIKDFRKKMVFKNMKAYLAFAFRTNTRTNDFRKPVNIIPSPAIDIAGP